MNPLSAVFPNVETPCPSCSGFGKVDLAHHGSPDWEDCDMCKGGTRKIHREMTTNEKLEYLLDHLSEHINGLEYHE